MYLMQQDVCVYLCVFVALQYDCLLFHYQYGEAAPYYYIKNQSKRVVLHN